MNRRSFIQISTVGAAVMTVPLAECEFRNPAMENPLAFPKFLSKICDDKTIFDIGAGYRKKFPAISQKEQLEKALLTDSDGKVLPSSSDKSTISEMLERKIQRDFGTSNTVFINGWVLSETEAGQCALFSITYQ